MAVFAAQLDRVIPADETIPLKGATFADFEDRVETLARAALPVALEEGAAPVQNAQVAQAGRCPHCGSGVGKDTAEAATLAERLEDALSDGQVAQVIATLQGHAQRLGPPQAADGP